MKRIVVLCLLFLLSIPYFSYASDDEINVIINGQNLQSDVSPQIVNNVTYVPIRPFFEALGFRVQWFQLTNLATASYGNPDEFGIGFRLNNNQVLIAIGGSGNKVEHVTIPNSAIMIQNSIYVPLRSFAELIGSTVTWDQQTNTVNLNVTKDKMATTVYTKYFASLLNDPSTQLAPQRPQSIPQSQIPNQFQPVPTSGVIESQIDGDFNGYDSDAIFKLMNGQIWQQISGNYEYHYSYMPEVTIYPAYGGYQMKVDGMDDSVSVVRLK